MGVAAFDPDSYATPEKRTEVYDLLGLAWPGMPERIPPMEGAGCAWHVISTPFVLWEDGVPVSHAGVLEIELVVGGQPMRVGGIHAVVTRPDHRGRGHQQAVGHGEADGGHHERSGLLHCRRRRVRGRRGATTLAELSVAGLPALLVPYPFAADDHQAENAAELVEAGGALMVRQGELDAARLEELLCELLLQPARLEAMGRAMRRCGRPDAAAAIADLLLTRYVQRRGP